ncbi:MAG: STAS domain-containing protein [Phycisphaeraceae bacterium]|nr:MAG: STAS domain-containing protein [Phycisphaeraceae bacterium]
MADASDPGAVRHCDASVEIADGRAIIRLTGHLDADTLAPLWGRVFRELRAGDGYTAIVVDGAGLDYCDGAGIGLFVELDREAKRRGVSIEFAGLTDGLSSLLDRALLADPTVEPDLDRGMSSIEHIGRATATILKDCHTLIAFVGELCATLAWAVTHPHQVRFREAFVIAEKAGVNAVPVVCLLGWLMGVIISFQSAAALRELGVESLIPTMLGIAMVRELGPLVTAIILAGRSGSAFAAELGTMKVTEEINALTTLGINPTRYLVAPRLLAAMAMTPLLSIFGTLSGLLGGYLVMASMGFSFTFYVNEIVRAVDSVDFLQGLFKAVVFAFLVTAVGCLKGLETRSGPGAVGDSTTRAVVAGIVLVIAVNGIFGVAFFYIGI